MLGYHREEAHHHGFNIGLPQFLALDTIFTDLIEKN
jgi:hypothetical protein